MEEEINYSTVVFKNGGPIPRDKKEDLIIYSEVQPKGPATTVPEKKEDPVIYSEVKPKCPATKVSDGEAAAHADFRALDVCLVILCVLLVASISTITYITVEISKQNANLRNFTAENQLLIMKKNILEREKEELSRITGNLNRTLGFILKFNTFPVNEYCPGKTCQPCTKDWILFQKKCYLFYNEDSPWKTWGESQKFCKDTSADLVVIDSLREQEFISNNTKSYYDKCHGYWFGLYKNGDVNWLRVDGHNDTLGYWMKEDLGTPGPCALMIPGRNLTASWDPADCGMQNKFICESEALIWSN